MQTTRNWTKPDRFLAGLAWLLIVFLPGARTAAAQGVDAQVVARVNGTPITAARFTSSYVQHLILSGRNDTPEARHAHLDNLIDSYLLADEARRRGLDDAAYEAYIDRRIKRAVGGRFFEIAFADSIPPLTDAEARLAFARSKEKVILRHLFFRNAEEAGNAYRRLDAGEDFLVLANACFGTAAFDSLAGYLGAVGYWDLDDAVAEAAFSLPVGQYSKPVRSRFGWHILRVEDRIRNPLLTEDEYRYRREGIQGMARARRFRLEGDRFVRALMERLDVRVDRAGLQALEEAIRRAITGPDFAGAAPRFEIADDEVRALRQDLTPETPLATYTLEGEAQTFRALDYLGWLEELPYREVRYRPAASVGRALRNEVLALKGLAMGLEKDPSVREVVQYEAALFLADRLRTYVRSHERVSPSERELRAAFERLGYRRVKQVTAAFWQIPFATLPAAEAARRTLTGDSLQADAYAGYRYFPARDLAEFGELGSHIQRAPLNTPVVIGTGGGEWFVVEVDSLTPTHTTFEEARPELEQVLSRHLPEINLVRELRRQAKIEIDRVLFEQMMRPGGSV